MVGTGIIKSDHVKTLLQVGLSYFYVFIFNRLFPQKFIHYTQIKIKRFLPELRAETDNGFTTKGAS